MRARPSGACACARWSTLGVLAVATALLGRAFGLHDVRFLGSEIALLISMFVISRYVLPLLERHDRGATGEEQVGALLEVLADGGWRVIHDVTLGHGNVDHILIGPAGVFTVETKSHPGPVRVGRVHGRTLSQAQAQRKAIERVTGRERRAAGRLQPRLGRQAAGAAQGRARGAGADADRIPDQAAARRSPRRNSSGCRSCCDGCSPSMSEAAHRPGRPLARLIALSRRG